MSLLLQMLEMTSFQHTKACDQVREACKMDPQMFEKRS